MKRKWATTQKENLVGIIYYYSLQHKKKHTKNSENFSDKFRTPEGKLLFFFSRWKIYEKKLRKKKPI